MIYLDNNATTKIDEEVLEEMKPYLIEEYGNPSSRFYTLAKNAEKAVENARKNVAKLINAKPEEIIFTSSGTESNNFIIKGVADYYKNYLNKGNHILTSTIEHDSITNTCKFLNGEIFMNRFAKSSRNNDFKLIDRGYSVDFVDIKKDGTLNINELKDKINSETIIGSFIWANNETGFINPIDNISDIFYKNDIFLHSDATQAVGKIKVDVKEINIDSITFSSHKIYGPKGVAALYLKKDKYRMPDITSLIHGGNNQEFGYRAGTLPVHNIVGFGKAAEIAHKELTKNINHYRNLEKEFIKLLKNKYPDVIIISNDNGVPGVVSYIVPGLNNMLHIRKVGDKIAFSSGSACSITEESRVLKSLGLGEYKSNFFRVSFSKYISSEDFHLISKYI